MPRARAAAIKRVEVGERAELRVDVEIVGDVVAPVDVRGLGKVGLSQSVSMPSHCR